MIGSIDALNEAEKAVILAIKPGFDMLVLAVPSYAQINDFAAADALASLKKKGLLKFEGRGKFRSCYLTDECAPIYEALTTSASEGTAA